MPRINYDAINELRDYNNMCIENLIDTRENHGRYNSMVGGVAKTTCVMGVEYDDFFGIHHEFVDPWYDNGTLTFCY